MGSSVCHSQGDVSVAVGSGLGGGSLINCAVVIEPEDAVFEQGRVAGRAEVQGSPAAVLRDGPAHAGPAHDPQGRSRRKLKNHLGPPRTLEATGRVAGRRASRSRSRSPSPPAATPRRCGSTAACSAAIAHRLQRRRQEFARHELSAAGLGAGVLMFTQVEVERHRRGAEGYRVALHPAVGDRVLGPRRAGFVTARSVILAARHHGDQRDPAPLPRPGRDRGLGLARQGLLGQRQFPRVRRLPVHRPCGVDELWRVLAWPKGTPRVPVGASIQGIIDFRRPDRRWAAASILEDLAHAERAGPRRRPR